MPHPLGEEKAWGGGRTKKPESGQQEEQLGEVAKVDKIKWKFISRGMEHGEGGGGGGGATEKQRGKEEENPVAEEREEKRSVGVAGRRKMALRLLAVPRLQLLARE